MISHEFEFVNNTAYIHTIGTKSGVVVQPFNPTTQRPWTSEEEAHAWALRDYGYLLVPQYEEVIIPSVSTYTELPGWPTSYTGTEYTYTITDTGLTWCWNGKFWNEQNETFIITATVSTHTDLPGYPNSYPGELGTKYLVSTTDHVWRWNSLSWDDIGKYEPKNIGEK